MRNKQDLTYKILKIAGAGLLVTLISIAAPQFPYLLLKKYLKTKFNQSYKNPQLRNRVDYLKRKRFIAYTHGQFTLTRLGKVYLQKSEALKIQIPKIAWDNKWRIVSFDIPESKKPARHVFRRKLRSLNFYHFQRSVFIFPYPCQKELKQLSKALQIDQYIFIWTAERFAGDKKLIKKFKL